MTIFPIFFRILDLYTFTSQIEIDEKQKKIISKSILSYKNGKILQVDSPNIRLLMARYFVRLNSSFRFGCFTIHPLSGEICLKMNSFMTDNLYDQLTKKPQNLLSLLKTTFYTIHIAL